MILPPLPIVITASIFIIAGFVGIAYHANEYFAVSSISYALAWAFAIRVLAIVCGFLLLSRVKWARWLAITWLAYHVVLSLFHSVSEVITHFILLVIISILLFIPNSSAFFRSADKQDKH